MRYLPKGCSWVLFVFWTLVSIGTFVAAVLHPLEFIFWASFLASLLGVAMYYPFPVTARVTQVVTVRRPIGEVFDFVVRPANQSLWNRRAGLPTPLDVPAEVGQTWTQGSARGWTTGTSIHRFSKLDRPHEVEVVADGPGFHATYSYTLTDHDGDTEVTLTSSMDGFPAVVAWLTPISNLLLGRRLIGRFKQAIEAQN